MLEKKLLYILPHSPLSPLEMSLKKFKKVWISGKRSFCLSINLAGYWPTQQIKETLLALCWRQPSSGRHITHCPAGVRVVIWEQNLPFRSRIAWCVTAEPGSPIPAATWNKEAQQTPCLQALLAEKVHLHRDFFQDSISALLNGKARPGKVKSMKKLEISQFFLTILSFTFYWSKH